MTTFSKSWNFNDPLKVSAYLTSWETEIHVHSSATFRGGILERDAWTCRTFACPDYPEQGVSSVMRENRSSLIGFMSRADGIADLANVLAVAGTVGSSLVLPALGIMIGMIAFQFLLSRYQTG